LSQGAFVSVSFNNGQMFRCARIVMLGWRYPRAPVIIYYVVEPDSIVGKFKALNAAWSIVKKTGLIDFLYGWLLR